MLAELTVASEALCDAIRRTDPALMSGVECASMVELLARTEKRSAALRALAAARAAGCRAHKERGFSSPERWLADASGITSGEARAALELANQLDACPQTKEALLDGELSLAQAAEITKTEAAAPGSESALLELAGRTGSSGLKEEARRRRLEAQNADELYRRQRGARYFRHWPDDNGMIRITGAFTPEVGVALVNRVDAETDRLVRQGRRQGDGEPESRECVAADALENMVLDGSQARSRRAELVLVCDIAAFQRGHTEGQEVCHVIGGGPVPVSVAVELASCGFIKAVLHNGVQIETVAHFGRHINARLRTALGLGAPPNFTGTMCADCDRRYGLQWDHVDPVANHGPTCYDNIQPRCWPCHNEKTRRDREAGLLGPHPPPGPDPPSPA